MKAAVLLLWGWAGLAAAPAPPAGLAWQATLDLAYRNDLQATGPHPYQDPTPRPHQYQAALTLVGNRGDWTGGLVLRDVNFYQLNPDVTLARADATLYRKYLKFSPGPWTLVAGDFNGLLGRGLILSVVPVPALFKDQVVDGGDAHYQQGRWDLRVLGGTVSTEPRDQQWKVSGLEATVEWLPGNRAGVRAGTIQDARTPAMNVPLGLRQCRSGSLAGSNLLGMLDYYGEVARIDYRDQQPLPYPSDLDPRLGEGSYASAGLHRGPWQLLWEYKRYLNFDDELNNPPLADRDTEKNFLPDSHGRRLFAQYSFRDPDLAVFLSCGRYQEFPLSGQNVYGGFKLQDGFGRLDLACTYGLRTVQYPEKKTNASLTFRFDPRWSLDLTLWDKRNQPPGSAPYSETDLTVQLARSPLGAVYLTRQASTLAVFSATRLYSGGVRVQLPRGSYLDFMAGRLRGGEVCAGGQCVTLPPFDGWKLLAHLRF